MQLSFLAMSFMVGCSCDWLLFVYVRACVRAFTLLPESQLRFVAHIRLFFCRNIMMSRSAHFERISMGSTAYGLVVCMLSEVCLVWLP